MNQVHLVVLMKTLNGRKLVEYDKSAVTMMCKWTSWLVPAKTTFCSQLDVNLKLWLLGRMYNLCFDIPFWTVSWIQDWSFLLHAALEEDATTVSRTCYCKVIMFFYCINSYNANSSVKSNFVYFVSKELFGVDGWPSMEPRDQRQVGHLSSKVTN